MIIPSTSPITRLYLLRHARTLHNAQGFVSGDTDISLDEIGLKQASNLAKRLKEFFPIQEIYSSPYKRAVDTAKIVAKEFGLQVNTDPNLIEFDFGLVENKPFDSLKEEDPVTYNNMLEWSETNSTSKMVRPIFPGWETIEGFKKRIQTFTEIMLKKHSGKSIAAVSHGAFIKSCLVFYAGGSFKKKTTFRVDNASISIIDFYKGNSVIRLVNDISHTGENISRERPLPL